MSIERCTLDLVCVDVEGKPYVKHYNFYHGDQGEALTQDFCESLARQLIDDSEAAPKIKTYTVMLSVHEVDPWACEGDREIIL